MPLLRKSAAPRWKENNFHAPFESQTVLCVLGWRLLGCCFLAGILPALHFYQSAVFRLVRTLACHRTLWSILQNGWRAEKQLLELEGFNWLSKVQWCVLEIGLWEEGRKTLVEIKKICWAENEGCCPSHLLLIIYTSSSTLIRTLMYCIPCKPKQWAARELLAHREKNIH